MDNQIEYINIDNWEREFYIAYNDAFRCYLQNQPPICFMNVFLEKIAKITKSVGGYIIHLYEIETETHHNIEAIYKDKNYEDFVLYNKNWKIILNNKSLCYKSIFSKKIEIMNEINEYDVLCEPINLLINNGSYVCIPYKFNDKIIGVLGLFGINKIYDKMLDCLNILGNLLATLQNGYCKINLTSKYNDKRLITYQLLDDILNTVHDALIVVDDEFEIIHTNIYTIQLISELYPDDEKNLNDGMTLIELFPEIVHQTNEFCDTKKIYKNKKIDVMVGNNKIKKLLEFTLNTVMCSGNFYHLTTIHCKKEQCNNNLNEKKLIAFLSHELRNPLQSITLANHLLKTNIYKDNEVLNLLSEKTLSYFNIINKSCEDMKKIINDILDLSKLESNDFSIEMEVCDTYELIDSLIDEYNEQALSKKIILEKNISDNVPSSIYTDFTRSRQILSNLISNAIKYSSDSIITMDVSISNENVTNANVEKKYLKFSVIDKGDGMKENEIDKLFKTHSQISTKKKDMTSQGLGLCVSQKIANLLGGKITVKSEFLKGSTFSFYHPIKLEQSGNKYESIINIGKLSGSILLVDDNPYNLTLLHTLIEQFTYEYVWALKIESVESGGKAIEMCKYNEYDIIFMDINMPGINGCTASSIIKSNGFKGKIIATTGNILLRNENKNIGQFENYNNFDEVILKPFDDQIILKFLRKYLSAP